MGKGNRRRNSVTGTGAERSRKKWTRRRRRYRWSVKTWKEIQTLSLRGPSSESLKWNSMWIGLKLWLILPLARPDLNLLLQLFIDFGPWINAFIFQTWWWKSLSIHFLAVIFQYDNERLNIDFLSIIFHGLNWRFVCFMVIKNSNMVMNKASIDFVCFQTWGWKSLNIDLFISHLQIHRFFVRQLSNYRFLSVIFQTWWWKSLFIDLFCQSFFKHGDEKAYFSTFFVSHFFKHGDEKA